MNRVELVYGNCRDDNFLMDRVVTVQRWDYDLHRSLNEVATPYGDSVSVIMNITFKISERINAKLFLQHLNSNEVYDYSILFDAVYEDSRLKSFEKGMVLRGFVVDVVEHYDDTIDNALLPQTNVLTVQLQLVSITFLSEQPDCDKHLVIFDVD